MMNDTPRTFVGATTLRVEGMATEPAAHAVAAEVSRLPRVDEVTADPSTGLLTVVAGRPVDRADVASAVRRAGFVVLSS